MNQKENERHRQVFLTIFPIFVSPMNYQYHHDGTNSRYTVNGTDYDRLEDVPEEHRAYFENMDKNKNGVPDNIEGLFDAMNNSGGNPSFGKVLGALFKTVGENAVPQKRREAIDVQEVTEEKRIDEPQAVVERRPTYDKRGSVVQRGESSFLPTLIKIIAGVAVIVGILWYFGVIR